MLTTPRDADVPHPLPFQSAQETVLTWRVHLLRGQGRRLPRLAVVAFAVLAGGVLFFHNLVLAALPTLALVLSLSEFLFPVRYTLTRSGARARHGLMTLEIPWAEVRHAYLGPDGIKLSPLAQPNSRMEPLRGVYLRFGGHEEAVTETVKRLRREAADAE